MIRVIKQWNKARRVDFTVIENGVPVVKRKTPFTSYHLEVILYSLRSLIPNSWTVYHVEQAFSFVRYVVSSSAAVCAPGVSTRVDDYLVNARRSAAISKLDDALYFIHWGTPNQMADLLKLS